MNKKISLGAAISLMAIVAAITFVLANTFSLNIYNKTVSNVKEKAEIYKKLDEIDAFVRENYQGEINENTLINALANGYMASLGDKYARYIVANEYSRLELERQGVSFGVGLELENAGGYALVKSVYEGSSAKTEGILPGEYIIKINGVDLLAGGYDVVVPKLSGEVGSTVMVTVRNSESDRDLVLTRSKVTLTSVEGTMYNEMAYFKFLGFTDKTPTQFSNLLNTFIRNGAKAVILDVRNVSSNYVEPCVTILQTLLPQGEFAYSIVGEGEAVLLGESTGEGVKMPMAVLVNGASGGASELLASALRDADKAVLIGTKTQGRGVKEEYFECLDGSGICMTTGILRTHKSETFNIVGLQPNYEVTLTDDSSEAIENLDETTDAQLKKAIEYLSATLIK